MAIYDSVSSQPADDRRGSRSSVGVARQQKLKAPLFVGIIGVVFTATALIGIVVGYLTLSKANETINNITGQMRQTIMERAKESVNGTLVETNTVLAIKSKNYRLSQFIQTVSANKGSTVFTNETEAITFQFETGAQFSSLENAGIVFQEDSSNRQLYLAAYPHQGPAGTVYFQDYTTNYTLRAAQVTQVNNDYSLTLNSTSTFVRGDWYPNKLFPILKQGGVIPGQPFFGSPVYTPVFKTFLIFQFWPVWGTDPLLPVGQTIPGTTYTAAHFVALSIKSLDNFLQSIQITQNGVIALIDGNSGKMLAASVAGISQNGTLPQQFMAIGNPNGLIDAASSYLANNKGNGTIQSIVDDGNAFEVSFKAFGDDQLVNAVWITVPNMNLKWLLLLVIPSNDFIAEIKTTMQHSIIFIAVFCFGAVVVAGILSWFITAPLRVLTNAMVGATKFDFSALRDGYLDQRSHVTEIGKMQGVFNEMMLKFADAIKSNKSMTGRGGLSQSQSESATNTASLATTEKEDVLGRSARAIRPM
ncbi:hypothetical protein HDU76_005510 [Blyttiomyces sp. JEL0837]|nr:hypothetical protein HDU76_005510 [Blyttiomyces sp. JEL0837]